MAHGESASGFRSSAEQGLVLFFRVQNSLARALHDFRCKGVLDTAPLRIVLSGLKILSMVRHSDVIMYLVAVKSLYKRIGHGEIVIIDDGTLTAADRALIEHHTKPCRFIRIAEISTHPMPVGGTWERLVTAVELSQDAYVIQVDSDTLTRNDVTEVCACVDENRSFLLGTRTGQAFMSLPDATALARGSAIKAHVQDQAELCLAALPDAGQKRYVRGCSGFAGFAKGAHSREDLIAFSAAMTRFMGKKWSEWGSEQVASNYMIANSENAVVLPAPKYANFNRELDPKRSSFIHFIGTNRFYQGVYASESRLAFATI